jgi:anti-sigma-K factor RskA
VTAPDPHAPFDELAAGFALGALEPEEEQALLRHLPSCARCERSVAEHAETLAHLAYAAEPAALPASLWEGIRAGVEASGREVRFPSSQPEPAADPGPTVVDLDGVRRRRAARRALLSRAAAVVSVAAGAALVVVLIAQNAAMREERDQQLAWSAGVERVLSSYGSDVRMLPLTAQGSDRASAVAVVEGDRLHLVVDALEANDRERTTYVLWAKTVAGDVRAVGAFDVIGDHDVEVVDDLRLADPALLKALVVTHEKGRKAPASSTQPAVASVTL